MRTTQISKTFGFESAHRLPNLPPSHKCSRLHGHSFKATVTLEGPLDPQLGWVLDFGVVSELMAPIIQDLDHHYLNEIEGLENPTAELIAHYIFKRFNSAHPTLQLISVTVHETCAASATVTSC